MTLVPIPYIFGKYSDLFSVSENLGEELDSGGYIGGGVCGGSL